MRATIAVDEPHGSRLAREMTAEGVEVRALLRTQELLGAVADAGARAREALRDCDVLVLRATRATLAPDVIALCDRSGVRILPLVERASERRLAASAGLPQAQDLAASAEDIAASIASGELRGEEPREPAPRGSITVVWGPHGAPGRTTVALALAAARAGVVRTVVVDADTHAPSVAQRLGLPDESPGFPAACRQTDYGILDPSELTRLSLPVEIGGRPFEVLTGINRPGRWPELSEARVLAALDVARGWCDEVIVDVAAPTEADEEILSADVDAPRRNAATRAALAAADRIVAVAAADTVGLARFVRDVASVTQLAPAAELIPVVNRARRATLGVDGRSQTRQLLARFASLERVAFLPDDSRAADRALLDQRPIAPRRGSSLAQGIRGLAATL